MKKIILIMILFGLIATPASALPTVEFGPAGIGWYYTGTSDGTSVSGTLSFNDNMGIVAALSGTTDPVVGAYIDFSDLAVTGTTGSTTYNLGSGSFTISSDSGGLGTVYLTGTIEEGILAPSPIISESAATLSAVTSLTLVNQTSPSSEALALMDAYDGYMVLQLTGAGDWQALLDTVGTNNGNDGMNGQITIIQHAPAPGAILLGGIGVALVGWLRKRRELK